VTDRRYLSLYRKPFRGDILSSALPALALAFVPARARALVSFLSFLFSRPRS